MYFPYLRGRQFELIALRELVAVLSPHIIPIIEPVKLSATLISTIKCFEEQKKKMAVIVNPQVGDFDSAIGDKKNGTLKEQFITNAESPAVIKTCILNRNSEKILQELLRSGVAPETLITVCNNKDYIPVYENIFKKEKPQYNLISDESTFRRRIRDNLVLLSDKFKKKSRNSDYVANIDEPFSDDHLYYREDGYIGFSDYSIIGDEYTESGFAPYAVAIHIVYFDDSNGLRIRHFVSDTNDDISDPAKKFAEAVGKLVDWNRERRLDTLGIKVLEAAYQNESYPGLGTVKKLSIMHHLELMGQHLDRVTAK